MRFTSIRVAKLVLGTVSMMSCVGGQVTESGAPITIEPISTTLGPSGTTVTSLPVPSFKSLTSGSSTSIATGILPSGVTSSSASIPTSTASNTSSVPGGTLSLISSPPTPSGTTSAQTGSTSVGVSIPTSGILPSTVPTVTPTVTPSGGGSSSAVKSTLLAREAFVGLFVVLILVIGQELAWVG